MPAKFCTHFVALVAVVFLSTTAFAQHVAVVPGFGIEAGIGYYTLSGDDFDGTDPGIGFEGEARYTLASGFQLAGGVSYNIHGVDLIDENRKILGVFAEPRYLFALKSPNLAPFIGRSAFLSAQIFRCHRHPVPAPTAGHSVALEASSRPFRSAILRRTENQ